MVMVRIVFKEVDRELLIKSTKIRIRKQEVFVKWVNNNKESLLNLPKNILQRNRRLPKRTQRGKIRRSQNIQRQNNKRKALTERIKSNSKSKPILMSNIKNNKTKINNNNN